MSSQNGRRVYWRIHCVLWGVLALALYALGFADGVFDLPWWGYVLSALALTHVTIISVTIYLHRHQAHRGLELHPIASHFFRFWLWLSTGTVTKEWAAVHRKHHAKVETEEDPHSPKTQGLRRVLLLGAWLYRIEADKTETLERYGRGTPDDWLERNLYTRFTLTGLTLMGFLDMLLFGFIPGGLIMLLQIIWIPFWAAGIVNGVGHYFGYRNADTKDSSHNIIPWGIVIGGEELHNNHHAHEISAKLSQKWYEFDIGWMYIRLLECCGLARVKRQHLAPVSDRSRTQGTLSFIDGQTFEVLRRDRGMLRYALRMAMLGVAKKELRDAQGEYRTQLLILRDMLERKDWNEEIRLEYAKEIEKFKEARSALPYLAEFAELFNHIQASARTESGLAKSDTTIKEEITAWLRGAVHHPIPGVSKFAQKVIWSVIPRVRTEKHGS